MQYTLRAVPRAIDAELRRRVRQTGRSLNSVALEALERGMGLAGISGKKRDVSDIAGHWVEDEDFDEAVSAQHRVDRGLWR